jgi:hypothetical protein
MKFPCRFPAVTLPCRSAKGLDCVFPIWFTQCGRVWSTHHAVLMPFPCRSPDMPRICFSESETAGSWQGRGRVAAGSRQGRGRLTAWEQRGNGMVLCESNNSIGRLETACWPPANVRLRAATTQSSRKVVTRNIPISDTGGQCETKQHLSWTRERHGKGMVCVNRALKR